MSKHVAYEVRAEHPAVPVAMTLFTPEEFFRFWPKLEKMLDQLPHTWRHWTKEYIQEAVGNNIVQCWGIGPPPDAVLVLMTQINVYPAMRVFNVVWAAGNFTAPMGPLLDATFTNYALAHGCSRIEVRGRDGWTPHLKTAGFRREASVWSKDIYSRSIN